MDAEVAADSEHAASLDVAIKVSDLDAGEPAGTTGGIWVDLVPDASRAVCAYVGGQS